MSDDKPRTTMFPIDYGGVLTAAAKAAGFVEIASTPAINHGEIKGRRGVTIKSSPKVTTEDLLNDDPIWPFEQTRPSEVAEEITEIEDERVLATALGASKDLPDGPTTHSTTRFQVWEEEGSYSVPVQFAEEVAAALLSAAGGEE